MNENNYNHKVLFFENMGEFTYISNYLVDRTLGVIAEFNAIVSGLENFSNLYIHAERIADEKGIYYDTEIKGRYLDNGKVLSINFTPHSILRIDQYKEVFKRLYKHKETHQTDIDCIIYNYDNAKHKSENDYCINFKSFVGGFPDSIDLDFYFNKDNKAVYDNGELSIIDKNDNCIEKYIFPVVGGFIHIYQSAASYLYYNKETESVDNIKYIFSNIDKHILSSVPMFCRPVYKIANENIVDIKHDDFGIECDNIYEVYMVDGNIDIISINPIKFDQSNIDINNISGNYYAFDQIEDLPVSEKSSENSMVEVTRLVKKFSDDNIKEFKSVVDQGYTEKSKVGHFIDYFGYELEIDKELNSDNVEENK